MGRYFLPYPFSGLVPYCGHPLILCWRTGQLAAGSNHGIRVIIVSSNINVLLCGYIDAGKKEGGGGEKHFSGIISNGKFKLHKTFIVFKQQMSHLASEGEMSPSASGRSTKQNSGF